MGPSVAREQELTPGDRRKEGARTRQLTGGATTERGLWRMRLGPRLAQPRDPRPGAAPARPVSSPTATRSEMRSPPPLPGERLRLVEGTSAGTPNGIRTRVAALKGQAWGLANPSIAADSRSHRLIKIAVVP